VSIQTLEQAKQAIFNSLEGSNFKGKYTLDDVEDKLQSRFNNQKPGMALGPALHDVLVVPYELLMTAGASCRVTGFSAEVHRQAQGW
jgi:hypothetical protein